METWKKSHCRLPPAEAPLPGCHGPHSAFSSCARLRAPRLDASSLDGWKGWDRGGPASYAAGQEGSREPWVAVNQQACIWLGSGHTALLPDQEPRLPSAPGSHRSKEGLGTEPEEAAPKVKWSRGSRWPCSGTCQLHSG